MMAVSQIYRFLWSLGTAFVFLPHLNLALLSDYKICGDSECQSLMSRVQAIRDHHGKDCRFLSFRQGDTIFVYHKLTGKRDDLWAGSIDKQFGYFPKDAVQEEQVYTTVEKVVETQKSDFFCMDEFDSTYLDIDDDDIDQKIQIQEPETIHIIQNTDMNVESHLTPSDSPVSAQKTEEDQTKNVGGSAAGSHEEARETPVTPNQQGGSHSSWLGSSVTGWLGLGKEEQPGSVAEGEMEDERKETQVETLLTSSVTGWLGFGGNGKPDNAKENVKSREGTADSLTSTMTGWLGFGSGSKEETDEEREADKEKEPKEKFRSRRMSLDLEGSQLHEDEKKEMGTLGWLGNGLSSTLGFGLTNQESGHEKEEKVQANSWLNMEIGGILGFQKDNFGDDKSGSKEAEKVIILEEPIGSQNVDNSQSKEEITETSNDSKEVEKLSEDQNVPSTEAVYGHSDEINTDTSDSGMTSGFHEEVEPTVDHKDISPHMKFEEESQALAGTPPSFLKTGDKEEKDDNSNAEKSKINEERSAEMEGEDPVIPKPIKNEHTDNGEPEGEAMKTPSTINQDFGTLSGSILASDHISADMKSKSTTVMEDEKNQMANKKAESVEEQGAEITNQADNTKEPTDTAVKTTTGDDKEETSIKGTDLPEIYTTQAEEPSDNAEDSSTESQLYLPSSVEKNDPVPAEDESFTPYSAETNDENSATLTLFDNSTETETVHGELEQKEETLSSQEFDSQHNTDRNTENISKEDRGTNESAPSTNQTSVSPLMEYIDTQSDSDAGKLEESFKDSINEFQQVQAEKEASGREEESLNENDSESAISSELETEKEEKLKDGGNQEVAKVKEDEGLGDLNQGDNTKEPTDTAVKTTTGDDKEEEVSIKGTDLPEIYTTQAEELSNNAEDRSTESQLYLPSSVEKNDPVPAEDESFTPYSAETNDENSDILALFDNSTETETVHGELEQKEETLSSQEFDSQHNTDRNTENISKEDRGTNESAPSTNQTSVSPLMEYIDTQSDSDAGKLEESFKDSINEFQQVQAEKEASGREEESLNENDSKSAISSELETEKEEKLKDGGNQEVAKVKENEGLGDLKEVKGVEEEEKEMNETEVESTQGELEVLKEDSKQLKTKDLPEEEKEVKVEELTEEEQLEDVEEKEKKEGEGKMEHSSHYEAEILNVINAQERESHDKDTQGEESSGPSFTEIVPEVEKREYEEKKQEAVEELKFEDMEGEEVKEIDQEKHEMDDNFKCLNELCPQVHEQNVRGGLEEGASSAGEGAVQQKNQKDTPGEPQMIDEKMANNPPEEAESVHVLSQRDKTEPEDIENSSKAAQQLNSDQQIHTEKAAVVVGDGDNDRKMENVSNGSETQNEGGWESSAPYSDPADSQVVTSEQTAPHVTEGSSPPSDQSGETAESKTREAFGLFKNPFGFFSQTPTTESDGSTKPAQSFSISPGEASHPQDSVTPEPDSTIRQIGDVHTDSPTVADQPQVHASSAEIHTLQTRTLSKHYKNLLIHMNADETTILLELFGRHKLQFLDYILSTSDTMSEKPDDEDESIMSDIERLLHHHRETALAPRLRPTDAPEEDKEKTQTLSALQKLETLLGRVRQTFNRRLSDNRNHQAEASCVGLSCTNHSKNKEVNSEEESRKTQDPSVSKDATIRIDDWMTVQKDNSQVGDSIGKDMIRGEKLSGSGEEEESLPHVHPASPEMLKGAMKQVMDFIYQMTEDSTTHAYAVKELLIWVSVQVVSSLPDDIRPGPDLYGVPWEPIIVSGLVGLVTLLLFTCRCYSSMKSRMYRSKERRMAEQVAQVLDEKCKVLESLSQCQQEYDDLESSLRDSGVLAQTQKTEQLEVKARQLEDTKRELERDLEELKDQLDQQREHRIEQERRIAVLEENMKTFEDETKDFQSQEEQAQTTLKVYSMNSDRLQRNLETAGEENIVLQESNAQLRQQVEGWAERVSELEAEMKRCEVAYSGMLQDVATKDERIKSLTDRLLSLKGWDSDLEGEGGEEGGEKEATNGTPEKGEKNGKGEITDTQGHLQKVQKLVYAAKLNADLKSVDEDKDRVFAKLNDEIKAKEDLQLSIEDMEKEKITLQSDTGLYSDQVQRLQQKLQIMTEMYQENELKLHRLLTVEERERLQKEEKLNKADKNIALAMEELNNYRQRAEEMEDELEKTKQSYQTQISAHEKKAHNNWLAARAAERDLSDIRRENALLRQKLTDTQFKLDALDKDPYALNTLARPMPFRAERSPYVPSPLGRPASETRPFLSPPMLMDGPPARLSPRVSRGPGEPLGGQGEMERSGGPHSDSGSNSPTWERDRRGPQPGPPPVPLPGPPGPLGPPGYMFPEPGAPMYRRPPPPPGALGLLPPPDSLPPGVRPGPLPLPPGPLPPRGLPPGPSIPADVPDSSYRENSFGPGEQDHRGSGPEQRSPPEADPRMGLPLPGPPMGPMDGPFAHRAPYGPPPPDFYPPRGPGGPPIRPMWAPLPPGVMLPPRFHPGGPPLPPAPHPHMPSYASHMRPPSPDSLPPSSMGPPPPQQALPSLPHSQSPEKAPSPEDAI